MFEFQIPTTIFVDDDEQKRIKVPLAEKPLSMGPSTSISARLYKVQYVLQFSIKHKVTGASQKTMPEAQIPVMIMTPSKDCVIGGKSKIKEHPNWQPYAFDCVEFSVSPESEKANEYTQFRRWLIKKEQDFVQKQKEKGAGLVQQQSSDWENLGEEGK